MSLALGVAAADRAEAGPPTDTLKDFFGAVNVVLTDPRTEGRPLERLRAIRRHVDDVFDFREAAMLALGREWNARSAVEQNQFVGLFADLLERAFVWRVAGKANVNGGVKVAYVGEAAEGDTASVDTALAARDGNDLQLQFRMVRQAGRWVVRDVVMDGVSTMENYHAQFQRIARGGSWGELVAQLRAKLGAPAIGSQAAAATVAGPVAPPPAPVVGPLASVEVDRPGPDIPHASAREVAAAVTPGAVVSDTPPALVRERAIPPASPAAATVVAPPSSPAPEVEVAVQAPTRHRAAASVVAATTNRGVGAVVASHPPSPVPAVAPARQVEPARAAIPTLAGERARPDLWIQVGAFRSATTAGLVADQVKGEIFVVAMPVASGGVAEPLLRVRVGPFPDRTHAAARLREIRALGYKPFLAAD